MINGFFGFAMGILLMSLWLVPTLRLANETLVKQSNVISEQQGLLRACQQK